MKPIDYFGNEIKVGDLVLYPNRKGSVMWMNKGTVMAIGEKDEGSCGKAFIIPVLQIKKVQHYYDGRFAGYYNVEVTCLDRVIALGRGYGDRCEYLPRKAQTCERIGPIINLDVNPLHITWLDRLMAWIRPKQTDDTYRRG